MIAYCRLDARIPRPSAHHVPCIDARHGPLGQLARPADGGAEQRLSFAVKSRSSAFGDRFCN
jgi:hypothetical protein